jgi:hypothetical protein
VRFRAPLRTRSKRISRLTTKEILNTQSVQQLNDSIILKSSTPNVSFKIIIPLFILKKMDKVFAFFRGTTAQQNWNGININSQLLVADFNTITTGF